MRTLKDTMLIIPMTVSRQDAIDKKLDSLKFKMFGKTFGRFDVEEMRDVWVPYSFITYRYLIDRKTIFNKNGSLNRAGELHFVFDYNEAHPFQYDMSDNGELELKKVSQATLNRIFLPPSIDDMQAKEKMEWHIQSRVLRGIYSTEGKISLANEKKFYRAAVEMKVIYGVNENLRYAYLDGYGVDSEHILGLKYQIG